MNIKIREFINTQISYIKKLVVILANKNNLLLSYVKKFISSKNKISYIKECLVKILLFLINGIKLHSKKVLATSFAFLILLGTTFVSVPSQKVSALAIKYEGNIIGYAKSNEKATKAKDLAIGSTDSDTNCVEEVLDEKIKTEKVEVNESKLDDIHNLSKTIVDEVDELVMGYGIYIDETLYCSFKNRVDAEFVISCLNNQIKLDYKTDEYDIVNHLEVKDGSFIKDSIVNFSDVVLDYLYDNLQIHTYKYTEKKAKLQHDTVYVVNKDLGFGDSIILSEGKNGRCKYYYKTTFLNGKRKSKELIKTDILKEPKTKTIEISQEEYNVLMANENIENNDYCFPLNTNNFYVSSLYGYRWGRVHGGIDLAVSSNTGIRAYKNGKVIIAEYNESYGNYIVVEHKNGLQTLYAHCDSLLADVGSKVKKGQIIALSGNTGRSTGPHLHFEIKINGTRVNPAKYIGIFAEENNDSKKVNDIIKTMNMTSDQLAFVNSIKDAAIEGYQHYNILPSLTISQAIIESAWGKSSIGNNIFGIKAFSDWKGEKRYVWTSEERADGSKYRCKAWFKDYDSITESVYDHTKLLLSDRYKKVREASNYREACYAVKAAGYATSSDYAQTLINTIETYGLYAWDDVNYQVDTTDINISDTFEEETTKIEKDNNKENKDKKDKKNKHKNNGKKQTNKNKKEKDKKKKKQKVTAIKTPVTTTTKVVQSTTSVTTTEKELPTTSDSSTINSSNIPVS